MRSGRLIDRIAAGVAQSMKVREVGRESPARGTQQYLQSVRRNAASLLRMTSSNQWGRHDLSPLQVKVIKELHHVLRRFAGRGL